MAKKNPKDWFRDHFIEEYFDVPGLVKVGFFQTKDPDHFAYIKNRRDYDRIEARIVKFFHLKSIYDYPTMNEEEPDAFDTKPAADWLREDDKLPIVRN